MATSFNGPLKVYQRRNPTNDGSGNGLVSTAGAAIVSQDTTYVDNGTVSETLNWAYLPAGSRISNILFGLTAGTAAVGAGTVNVNFQADGATLVVIGTIAVPALAAGASSNVLTASLTNLGIFNIGTTPGYISFGPESIGSGATVYASVEYVVRNTDGSITNTGANLSNN